VGADVAAATRSGPSSLLGSGFGLVFGFGFFLGRMGSLRIVVCHPKRTAFFSPHLVAKGGISWYSI
jgi:hypothetical protein